MSFIDPPPEQSYVTGDDTGGAVMTVSWLGQTFTTGASYNLASIKIKGGRAGSGAQPGTVNVAIRATSGGIPTGANLSTGSFDADSTPDMTSYDPEVAEWTEITMSALTLGASTKYAIIVSNPGGDNQNYYRWGSDQSSPTYADGEEVYSSDSGSSWDALATADMMFEVRS